ncbi:hypothetical protein CTA1_13014 [Colletotrichum tanaceti]|uniref:Uncharacterized protein n=1 Tax=Colletotrichum tanaceti TaxID=1306861 RepID=A0A4U6X8D5_9PEZI|nr:hypothetical protein CTA1_13014 [Colletotrichum tanaceti]
MSACVAFTLILPQPKLDLEPLVVRHAAGNDILPFADHLKVEPANDFRDQFVQLHDGHVLAQAHARPDAEHESASLHLANHFFRGIRPLFALSSSSSNNNHRSGRNAPGSGAYSRGSRCTTLALLVISAPGGTHVPPTTLPPGDGATRAKRFGAGGFSRSDSLDG